MASDDVPGARDRGAADTCALAFTTARRATGRGAVERHKKAENIDPENVDAVRAAEERFRTLPLLHAPELRALALAAATEARGPRVEGSTRFPATIWMGGATDTRDGRDFLGNFGDFVRLLEERAKTLAAKREGWVIEPTTNIDGHRTNNSTIDLHALFLDCDGRGNWHALLDVLVSLNYAYIAYQSGGCTDQSPKWRVILPLSQPFSTSTEEQRIMWKAVYHHCRVVFGALAHLLGEGFDPCTDTPCCPWFLTERRDVKDPPRKIVWQAGHSLDLISLVLALPPIEASQSHTTSGPREASEDGLTDEKLELVIVALSKATANLPSGRHELYLALPGVLLDRGVPPDEMLAIIEAVSASYPRSHLALHADNMHGARTTIGKWESGAKVTRIGTLNERWPEVAKAVDEVLPDKLNELLQTSIASMTTNQTPVLPTSNQTTTPQKKRRRNLSPLGKLVLPIISSMKKSSNDRRRYAASLVDRILDGETFQGGTPAEVDVLVCFTTEQLGYNLPLATTWNEVLDLANKTLLSMDFTQSVERVQKAQEAFYKGQGKKRKSINKNNIVVEAKRKKSRDLLNAAHVMTKDNR